MIPTISSTQNPRVKAFLELRASDTRARAGQFIVDEPRAIDQALRERWEPVFAFVCPSLASEEVVTQTVPRLQEANCEVMSVSEKIWRRLAYGDRRDGIVAVFRSKSLDLENIPLPPDAFVVILEGIEKPGNLGAVLRTADAVGAAGVILADSIIDPFNPNAIRASAGAVFHVPLALAPSRELRPWLVEREFQMLVARVGASQSIYDVPARGRVALVLGNESHGVSDVWHGTGCCDVSLPMRGLADSLNVSVTAAVMLFELARRR